mgnify:CR=1 FL=1|jgi:hypothetical protein
MSTEVLQRKGGVRVLIISPEDGTFETFFDEFDALLDEAVNWQEVLKVHKRARSLRGSKISRDFLKGKTRKGLKKALQEIESCSVKEELKSYECQLADALSCRRELINEIFEIENYSVNISSGQKYKELKNLKTIRKLLNYVDSELIPELQQAVKGLSIAENDDRRRMRKVRNSNRQDRKHGLRVKKRPDQAYKRNRDIARAKKNATRIAFR